MKALTQKIYGRVTIPDGVETIPHIEIDRDDNGDIEKRDVTYYDRDGVVCTEHDTYVDNEISEREYVDKDGNPVDPEDLPDEVIYNPIANDVAGIEQKDVEADRTDNEDDKIDEDAAAAEEDIDSEDIDFDEDWCEDNIGYDLDGGMEEDYEGDAVDNDSDNVENESDDVDDDDRWDQVD